MRPRHLLAGLAAVSLLAVAPLALADAPSSMDISTASADRVVLPTGDTVRLGAGQAIEYLPGSGREGIGAVSPFSGQGDRLVIPADALSEVADGTLDPQLFNVDALRRAGVADARTLDSADGLDERGWDGTESPAADTEVTVDFVWRDGGVPADASVLYMNLETGDRDAIFAENGVGTAQLAPGRYSFVSGMANGADADFEYVLSAQDVTVAADGPTEITVDGTTAKPAGFATDKPSTLQTGLFEVASWSPDGKLSSGVSFINTDGTRMYGIPGEAGDGHDYSVKLHAGYNGPADAADPYRYNLVHTDESIPDDPIVAVHDPDLAKVDADYGALPGESTALRTDAALTPNQTSLKSGGPVDAPSNRTEYYTADPDVRWTHYATIGDPEAVNDTLVRQTGGYVPGDSTADWFGASAVSVGTGVADPFVPSGLWRSESDSGGMLHSAVPLFDDAADGVLLSSQVSGEAVLGKGDTELGRGDTAESVKATLAKGDSGRYTFSTVGTRDVEWTPFGTESALTWTFDSAPVDGPMVPADVSVVAFRPAGLTDGYASAADEQPVELEFVTQPGAEDRQCADLTFQVSYDDGASWSDVDIERDGDSATATLSHPEGAQYVSVKFTATDDKGQTVEHSTIRSYGLA